MVEHARLRRFQDETLAPSMKRDGISRIVAVAVGAAVLYGLGQGLGLELYVSIPAGVLAYIATLVSMRLMLGTDPVAK